MGFTDLLRRSSSLLRLIIGIEALGWVLILVGDGDTLAVGHNYDLLARVFHGDDACAAFFALVATLLGAAALTSWRWLRVVSAAVAGVAQGLVALSFLLGAPAGTGWLDHFWLLLLSYLLLHFELRHA